MSQTHEIRRDLPIGNGVRWRAVFSAVIVLKAQWAVGSVYNPGQVCS
jgi:hypothetical protein